MPGRCSLSSSCSTGVMPCEASVDTSPVCHTFLKFAAPNSWSLWAAMRRREFIKVIVGSAVAAWPPLVRAQQPATPVIGYLDSRSPDEGESRAAAFRRGLQESGYIVGRNVTIEYRWAEQQIDR